LAAGIRELFMLGEDYVSMEAVATGRQTGELAAQLDLDHREVSSRINRMNTRVEQEIGENIIEKRGHKWKLIPRLRREFAIA